MKNYTRMPLTTNQHILHLLISVFTAGLWLPVWIILSAVGNRTYPSAAAVLANQMYDDQGRPISSVYAKPHSPGCNCRSCFTWREAMRAAAAPTPGYK